MRLGWCMILLLLLTTTTSVSAQQVTERQVEEVSQSQQVLDRAQALKTLYERNEFRALEFNLSQLPPLAQEAVRENLVHYAAEFGKLDQAKSHLVG